MILVTSIQGNALWANMRRFGMKESPTVQFGNAQPVLTDDEKTVLRNIHQKISELSLWKAYLANLPVFSVPKVYSDRIPISEVLEGSTEHTIVVRAALNKLEDEGLIYQMKRVEDGVVFCKLTRQGQKLATSLSS